MISWKSALPIVSDGYVHVGEVHVDIRFHRRRRWNRSGLSMSCILKLRIVSRVSVNQLQPQQSCSEIAPETHCTISNIHDGLASRFKG